MGKHKKHYKARHKGEEMSVVKRMMLAAGIGKDAHHDTWCNCETCKTSRLNGLEKSVIASGQKPTGHNINCQCWQCRKPYTSTPALYQGYGGYCTTPSCKHFRQPVKVGEYTICCSAWRDLPKGNNAEALIAAAKTPDIGVYLDHLWEDVSDPIRVSPGIKNYPVCAKYYPTILVPWRDRGVPQDALLNELIDYLVKEIKGGKIIDIGCHGGHGRTGTLLGCLIAKLTDMKAAEIIKYVREKYCKEAIESESQLDAIYKAAGEEPPKRAPVSTTYSYGGNKATQDATLIADFKKQSPKDRLAQLTRDDGHYDYSCVECPTVIPEGGFLWHNFNWVYKICDDCHTKLAKEAGEQKTPLSSIIEDDGEKWELYTCGLKDSYLYCEKCGTRLVEGNKMWGKGDSWEELVCDPCYSRMLLDKVEQANKEKISDAESNTPSISDVEQNQLAFVLGYESSEEMAKDVQDTLANAAKKGGKT